MYHRGGWGLVSFWRAVMRQWLMWSQSGCDDFVVLTNSEAACSTCRGSMGTTLVIVLTACGLVILANSSGLGSAWNQVHDCLKEQRGRSSKACRYVVMALRAVIGMWLGSRGV